MGCPLLLQWHFIAAPARRCTRAVWHRALCTDCVELGRRVVAGVGSVWLTSGIHTHLWGCRHPICLAPRPPPLVCTMFRPARAHTHTPFAPLHPLPAAPNSRRPRAAGQLDCRRARGAVAGARGAALPAHGLPAQRGVPLHLRAPAQERRHHRAGVHEVRSGGCWARAVRGQVRRGKRGGWGAGEGLRKYRYPRPHPPLVHTHLSRGI